MAGTFPTLAGVDIRCYRNPVYSTSTKTVQSGKETRTSFWSTPRYRYTLQLNFLRTSGGGGNELSTLLAFIDSQKGNWDTFNFTDPYDASTQLCRFDMSEYEFDRVVNGIWSLKTLKLITVK